MRANQCVSSVSCASKKRHAGAGGCQGAFSGAFTRHVKAEGVTGGCCVRASVCVGCLKGHWLLQPPTDSSEPAKSTEMQQNLTDAPKYIIFPEKKNRFIQESDSYVDTINNDAQQVSEYTAACLQTLNIVCIMKREEMFSHTRMNKWTQVN